MNGPEPELWPNVNPLGAAALFGAPNDGCVIGSALSELFEAILLNTLPGVGGTAAGVELEEPPLNENVVAAPFSGSAFAVSDPPLNERMGFVVDKPVGANDSGLFTPTCACVPTLGAPNRVVVFPVTPAVECP